jgi:NAD(P)-dependent dehydrogenase (short-subunit alcohol dehydrogenase family)
MDLQGASILILGGSGLVGHAVARRLLEHRPRQLVLVALTERETREAAAALAPYAGDATIAADFGNVYLPAALAQAERASLLDDPANRRLLLDDVFGDLSEAALERSFLFQLLTRHRPDAVVDCINTATAFAYQDVHGAARDVLARAAQGGADAAAIERLLLTMPLPQLTRHVQILVEALKRAGIRAYVKIGTSGTGGMGFNIPYTHSEERPSRTLLTKSAVAGAHTLLLYLLGRTPGAPATIEIKPTAAIGWREIARGPVRRGGAPIELYDCPEALPVERAFDGEPGWHALGRALESAYINMGENGLFALEEFATITALGQMEFITPEEIADNVVLELAGHPTGHDVVAALDAATSGPTYRAGLLREAALRRLADLDAPDAMRSIAFEMLGPPRLTKLLYEAHLFSRLVPSVAALARADAAGLGREAEALLTAEPLLRAAIISVGIPIVRRDGCALWRGPRVVVPPAGGGDPLAAAPRGWVDLREGNCALWIARARRMVEQDAQRRAAPSGSGSDQEWYAVAPGEPIAPWRMATWVFRYEDQGERIKR